jgi:hypothetical protein
VKDNGRKVFLTANCNICGAGSSNKIHSEEEIMNKLLAVLMGGLFAISVNVYADDTAQKTQWAANHPRRAEVNQRLANQNKRIHNEVKEGEISKDQAASLHAQDKQVRTEEKSMAAQNNGHITKAEKKALNQQENGVSKEIGK